MAVRKITVLLNVQLLSCASLAAASDDTGPVDAPALLRGAGLAAVGGTTGGIAEGVAEGHRAQRELLEVPLAPFFLNFQLHLPETGHQLQHSLEKRDRPVPRT